MKMKLHKYTFTLLFMPPKKQSDPYISPAECISPDEVEQRLLNYEQITDCSELIFGDHLQYFEVLADGKYKYKPGGRLIVNAAPVYIVLTNGRTNWSVQLDRHIIFREISVAKIKEYYETY